MGYLFLCAYGVNRSPTAVLVAQNIVRRKGIKAGMSSFGIKPFLEELEICSAPFFRDKLRKYLIGFDRIFVMEEYMARGIENVGIDMKKVHCLDIPDNYKRNEPALERILEEKLERLV
jgi:predicted protein tyrosine phosphatase